jgi:phage tail-like protein
MAPPADTGGVETVTRFSLTIDGAEIASFGELVGITTEAEPETFAATVLKKLPGKRKPPTLTLRRGLSRDLQLATWQHSVLSGDAAARKTCNLVMYTTDGKPVARYHLESAWPSKLEVGGLVGQDPRVLYETATLTCESVERVAP